MQSTDPSGRVAVLWLRRDLRLHDHPALLAAIDAAGPAGTVLPLFVLDPRILAGDPRWGGPHARRTAFLLGCLRTLDEELRAFGTGLVVRHGRPETVVPDVARRTGATSVHVSADTAPFGRARDGRVVATLAAAGVDWVPTGSPYAVTPGAVLRDGTTPYRVYTPFYRAWRARGWRPPAPRPTTWPVGDTSLPVAAGTVPLPDADVGGLPTPGEAAATAAWERFREDALDRYKDRRDRPDVAGTSRLSAYLRFGCLHPRTLLAPLADRDDPGAETFRKELAWREFYGDVLWHAPSSAWQPLDATNGAIETDSGPDADARFAAWAAGRTGYPIVDAGMRQLAAEGWVHNRVRMVVASFLVKDLHLPWQRGAAHFLDHLVDGDVASNNHGWQWVAGTGTDAAPYFRIFNPVRQGLRFDPDGAYVRQHVPELRSLAGPAAHEPWTAPGGAPPGYPDRIVDHAEERDEALRRLAAAKGVQRS